jgi:uncharacterized membrane protein YdcZ (DUF606 family)
MWIHFYQLIVKGAVIPVAGCIDVQIKKRHGSPLIESTSNHVDQFSDYE